MSMGHPEEHPRIDEAFWRGPEIEIVVDGLPVRAFEMTQPLLAGIVTALGGKRGGQAMGLKVFALFMGLGLGSLLFGEALRLGFPLALGIFASVQIAAGLAAIPLFRSEAVRPL